jgi:hypothetical protein
MFGWFKRRQPEPLVRVFLNPLVMLLAGCERQKGAPLNEEEVLAVRDSAQSTAMTETQAKKFYSSLDAQVSVPRIDPERIWEEWQEIRQHVRQ